jgi:hypothetical protein
MAHLASRQVHLDFHTSEFMPGVGSRFNRENFQAALKLGNLNSITVFSKCHHSWSYHPTEAGHMHPTLNFDLTGAMIAAAHEIGVKAPVYITVGWSANDAEELPECVERTKSGAVRMSSGEVDAPAEAKRPIVSWKFMCPSGRYAELIYKQTREVCQRYTDLDGLFYDICFHHLCWCTNCVNGMKRQGLNPDNDEDAKQYYVYKWSQFTESCRDILKEYHPQASLFFNGGANLYKQEWHAIQTHYEMEDLPTTWGGYDKMPVSAKYFAKSGKDYLGMTGKFHTMWGEFGGFKTADALRYEVAAMLTYGARCSVGDQMHPSGEMDLETYRIIGEAYRYVEQIEPYCYQTVETTRLGVLLSKDAESNEGITKILLEHQYDFDIAADNEPLQRFEVIVLPDSVLLDDQQAERLRAFIQQGGRILMTGTSGLNPGQTHFQLDVGANYQGPSLYENDFVIAGEQLVHNLVASPFLFYEAAEQVHVTDAEQLAQIKLPYFNRTYGHYCSHQNSPYQLDNAAYPAAIRKGNIVYLAHPLCKMYHKHGAQFHRDYFINALRLLYTDPVMQVGLLSSGRARFVHQPQEQRYILHLLYATPIQRGRTSVIEDLPPIYDVPVRLLIDEKVTQVATADGEAIVPFQQLKGIVEFTVPKVQCHQIMVITY